MLRTREGVLFHFNVYFVASLGQIFRRVQRLQHLGVLISLCAVKLFYLFLVVPLNKVIAVVVLLIVPRDSLSCCIMRLIG